MNPVPKPVRKPRARRAHNSTLSVGKPIKRSPPATRRERSLNASRKPVKKSNPVATAKRKKRQASKHRAYMQSETRKIVDARAGGRCEARILWEGTPRGHYPFVEFGRVILPGERVMMRMVDHTARCENTEELQHHHLTYARYGGQELPEDILKCCKRCHEWIERHHHPTRRVSA